MSSVKRKALDVDLQRRVRARREPSEELEAGSSGQSSQEDGQSLGTDEDSDSDSSPEDDEEDESDPSSPANETASISFGALAKAQASNPPSSKSKLKTPLHKDPSWEDNEALERQAGRKDRRDFNRTSKHAPTELSSKKAVSRKREVVPIAKRIVRDPRFDPLAGPVDEEKFRKAYAFLDEYREDEMKELKGRIKKEKDEGEREKLKRELGPMEERKKLKERRDRERQVIEKHRREEKERVRAGKKPFYLKGTEVKKRVLVEEFAALKGRKLDKRMERRRKKVEGKEKKLLPRGRRGVET